MEEKDQELKQPVEQEIDKPKKKKKGKKTKKLKKKVEEIETTNVERKWDETEFEKQQPKIDIAPKWQDYVEHVDQVVAGGILSAVASR